MWVLKLFRDGIRHILTSARASHSASEPSTVTMVRPSTMLWPHGRPFACLAKPIDPHVGTEQLGPWVDARDAREQLRYGLDRR